MRNLAYSIIFGVFVTGCAKKHASSTASTPAPDPTVAPAGGGASPVSTPAAPTPAAPLTNFSATAAITTITANLTTASSGIGAISLSAGTSLTEPPLALTSVGLASVWTTPSIWVSQLVGGSAIPMSTFVAEAMSPALVDIKKSELRGPLERLSEFAPTICAVDYFLPGKDSGGLAADGSGTFTMDYSDAGMLAKCPGMAASGGGTQAMLYQVSTPSDTSVYAKEYQFGIRSAGDNVLFFRQDPDGTIAMSYTMNLGAAGGGDGLSRSLIQYDPTTQVTRFEFIYRGSGSDTSYYVYRVLVDASNKLAYALLQTGDNEVSDYTLFTLAGSLASGSTNMAVGFIGRANQGLQDDTEYDGCIGPANTVLADDTLACSVTGVAASAATAPLSNMAVRTSVAPYEPTATMKLSFTNAADIFTAVIP